MALGETTERAPKGQDGHRDRRAERREATRAEILEHAWALAREEGLAGISLGELARRVGMRAPSLYSYFDSKHAIYDAMFAQGNAELAEVYEGRPTPGNREAFLEASRDFVDFCTEDPVRYQLLFQRTIPGFEPSPESYAGAVQALEETRGALEAIGAGSQEALDVYTAVMTGLTDQQISNDPGGDRWTRLVDDVVGMFLDRYAPHLADGRHPGREATRTKQKGGRR